MAAYKKYPVTVFFVGGLLVFLILSGVIWFFSSHEKTILSEHQEQTYGDSKERSLPAEKPPKSFPAEPHTSPFFVAANNPKGITYDIRALPREVADQEAREFLNRIGTNVPQEWIDAQYKDSASPLVFFRDRVNSMNLPEPLRQELIQNHLTHQWQVYDQLFRADMTGQISRSVARVASWMAITEYERHLKELLSDEQYWELYKLKKSDLLVDQAPHPYDSAEDPNAEDSPSDIFQEFAIRKATGGAITTEAQLFDRINPEKIRWLMDVSQQHERYTKIDLPDAEQGKFITPEQNTAAFARSYENLKQQAQTFLTRDEAKILGIEDWWPNETK